jgi:transposase
VAHYKRRPENVEPAKIEEFIATVKHYMETIDNDRIINIDETSWLLWPRGLLTWADTGAHSVQVRIQGDEKESMTATAAISASGTKLPLQIIAKGKTERVEQSQLGDVAYHWKSHCESGWQNESTFMDYLTKLKLFLGEGPTVVILDCYTAHRTENVKEKAKELGITLCFIPPGMTDELQPLDRSVFAVLKATARRLFHERCMHAPLVKRSKEEACQDLIAAWEHVGLTTIEDAWEIYV